LFVRVGVFFAGHARKLRQGVGEQYVTYGSARFDLLATEAT
jgi:hypothetical protein